MTKNTSMKNRYCAEKANTSILFINREIQISVMIFFFLVPLVYPLIYSFIYNQEVVREAPLAVVDDSHTSLSRDFVRRIDATPDVKVLGYYANMEEAKEMINTKKVYGILHIPKAFSKDIHQGRQTSVELFSDMSCLLYYKSFLLSSTEVSLDMAKEIRVQLNLMSEEASQQTMQEPIRYESLTMFNPQNGFAGFLVPSILILVIQQTLLLGICLLGGTMREHDKYGGLIPNNRRYHGIFRVVFGKSLAYVLVYIVVCFWTLIVVPALFHLPQLASFGTMVVFLLPFLFSCIFLSMTLSGFMTSRESPMLVFVFTSVILVFISGISWPMSAIPWFWKTVAYAIPSTPGIQGFVRINTMGATLHEVVLEYTILWIQTGVYFFTACAVYRRQLQLMYQHIKFCKN
ncbi:MAG: ABC transporter permease [Bacteroidales bacterium]